MAQQTVGRLNIVISATTGQLTSALAQAQTKVQAFSVSATRMPAVLKKTTENATNLVAALTSAGGLSGALKAVTREAAFLGSVSGNLVVVGAALATQFGVSVYDAFNKSKQAAKDAAEEYRKATAAARDAIIGGAGPAGVTAPEKPQNFDVQRIFDLPGLRQQQATIEARIRARQVREAEIRALKERLVGERAARRPTGAIEARLGELGRLRGGGVEDLGQRGVLQGKIQEIADGLLTALASSVRSGAGQLRTQLGDALSAGLSGAGRFARGAAGLFQGNASFRSELEQTVRTLADKLPDKDKGQKIDLSTKNESQLQEMIRQLQRLVDKQENVVSIPY